MYAQSTPYHSLVAQLCVTVKATQFNTCYRYWRRKCEVALYQGQNDTQNYTLVFINDSVTLTEQAKYTLPMLEDLGYLYIFTGAMLRETV